MTNKVDPRRGETEALEDHKEETPLNAIVSLFRVYFEGHSAARTLFVLDGVEKLMCKNGILLDEMFKDRAGLVRGNKMGEYRSEAEGEDLWYNLIKNVIKANGVVMCGKSRIVTLGNEDDIGMIKSFKEETISKQMLHGVNHVHFHNATPPYALMIGYLSNAICSLFNM